MPNQTSPQKKTSLAPAAQTTHFDWADLAFGSKKPINALEAIFIAAPRSISEQRFKQLVKTYLPQGNIILGIAKEDYIVGFEKQPQFKTLQLAQIEPLISKVNAAPGNNKIYTLNYFQRELQYLIDKLTFKKAVLINGSWQHVFHSSPAYYQLTAKQTPYEMISPFTDEAEARQYEAQTEKEIILTFGLIDRKRTDYTELELLEISNKSATRSYDYSFQTGATLARATSQPGKYELLISTFNQVVPFQTYAMHYGASREKHFSPPNDLNHYDAVHAEVWLLIEAQKAAEKKHPVSLKDTTLFINLMPCPPCARMLSQTSIKEIVYSIDHSDGYAIKMLEAAGKTVRRLVP